MFFLMGSAKNRFKNIFVCISVLWIYPMVRTALSLLASWIKLFLE